MTKANQQNYTENAQDYSLIGLDSDQFLIYRDLPAILEKYLFSSVEKQSYDILDYGCGTGFSAALYWHIFDQMDKDARIIGVDINEANLKIAREKLPAFNFELLTDTTIFDNKHHFDLVVCNFVLLENKFDDMVAILKRIRSVMSEHSILITTNNNKELYDQRYEWYSVNNHFPENQGPLVDEQTVKIEIQDKTSHSKFVVEDYFYSHAAYEKAFEIAQLKLLETVEPIGLPDDGFAWKSETQFPSSCIHVLTVKP